MVYKAQGELTEAATSYRKALGFNPQHAEAHYNLGNVLRSQGLLDEALASYTDALRYQPIFYDAHINQGNILKDQGRLDEALACYQNARRIDPTKPTALSNILYTMLFDPRYDAQTLAEEHRRWEREYALPPASSNSFANDPAPEKRLRIGYVSPDFSEHVIGRNLWPLLRHHDPRQFEIFLYDNAPKADALALKMRQTADHWRFIADWSDERVADKIRRGQNRHFGRSNFAHGRQSAAWYFPASRRPCKLPLPAIPARRV